MNPDLERCKEIFALALGIKSPAEREAYLAEAYQGSREMKQQVESLLQAHEQAGEFLAQNFRLPASSLAAERSGMMIGRYKLLEIVGEGGYGTVWMAEQMEPMRRRVALKVIKAGMDSKSVLARFEAERQALAMMDHPSIARVFDGGATDAGRPYFVMELVRGERITDYCDANKLQMRERLALFVQVCQAVQHAHQKGIIHRDLKPSNILVTEVNGAPVPKVIDFGVAKATQAPLTERTLFTGLHQMIGTPAYMSPEQAGLGALDMDTRSDIYCLGVLLYELLTGQTPLTKVEFDKAGWHEVFRLIREKDPPRPSTRLRTLTREELTSVAALRRAEPLKLNRLLNGDLDWIVMKALEKNRTRRYESASALAMDVQRHLQDEPITASPPSILYKFQKLVRRHRVAFTAGTALFVTALSAGLYWWFLPGTLILDITPADAHIEIDGREHPAGPMPRRIELSAGAHQIKFHKPEFTNEVRAAIVPRGGFFIIPHLALGHDQGTLNVECSPRGTGIRFEGVDYYSAIKERATDTGTHELTGFGEGFFEKHRVITIKHNEHCEERLSLEQGVSWKYPSSGVQKTFFILSNTLPNQQAVIASIELGQMVFLSSLDGSVLDSIALPFGTVTTFVQLDLGADVGRVIISGVEERGIAPELNAFSSSWPIKSLWPREEPSVHGDLPKPVSIVSVPNPGSVGGVAFAGQDGHVRMRNGRTGALEHDMAMASHPLFQRPYLASWNQNGRSYVLSLWSLEGTNAFNPHERTYQGALADVAANKILWRKDFGTAENSMFADLDHTGTPWILLWDDKRWRLFDPLLGALKSAHALPGRIGEREFTLADAEGKGVNDFILEFVDPTLPMMAVRPFDGSTIWQGPANVTLHMGYGTRMPHPTADGPLMVALDKSLLAVDSRTGKVRFELKAKPNDWFVDGQTRSIYAMLSDWRLLCLDFDGRTNWILRLDDELSLAAAVPSSLEGGRSDILLARPSGLIEMVHWPRLLWDVTATAALHATPLVVKSTDGKPVVVQLGSWGEEANLVGLDGHSGRILWSNCEFIPPNRAPALALCDDDGTLAVKAIGWKIWDTGQKLVTRRAADGRLVRAPTANLKSWVTGGAAADFRGLGQQDMAVSTYDTKRIVLIDELTGIFLWQQPTEKENMGGLAAVDLDGDGLPDVLATSLDGHVYAIRGKDGRLLWKTASDQYPSASPPTAADLKGDGRQEVLVTTEEGRLFVLNGADGSLIWSPSLVGHMNSVGRAIVVSRDGRKIILAPMGSNGAVAFDWSSRTELWRSPRGFPVIAAPVVADMAHDGRQQVVVGSTTGHVFVLDLADGKSLWQVKVAQNCIEADPAVADLNGDGIDDILIASKDSRLYAIDGRNIIAPVGATHGKRGN